jgi:ABC-2 type transport system ATP-binding protein
VSEVAIQVDGVSKRFRLVHERNGTLKATIFRGMRRTIHEDLWALDDVSFSVPTGSTYGVVGHNGSGKSTMLKCLARIYRPDQGTIAIRGRMSALLELGAGFHPELSGRENVYLNGSILGLSTKQINERFDEIVAFSGLERFIDSPVKNYSSGMFVRLGFAVAINVEPEVLLVDEVLAVGDESFQQKCLEKFADLRREGNTIVVVTHSLATVKNLCDEAVWLDHGHVMRQGPAGEVADAYLDSVQEERRATQPHQAEVEGRRAVDVELQKADGTATEAIRFGEGLGIAMRLEADLPVHRLRLDLHRTDGIHVAGTEVEVAGDALELTYRIPHLLLSPATYDVSIDAFDLAGHRIATQPRTARFDVTAVGGHETHGLIALGGTWSTRD